MKTRITILTILFILGMIGTSFALEISPNIKLGTINWKEGNINEGHKYLQIIGLEIKSSINNFKGTAGFEVWKMGEPIDEDIEMPTRGCNFYGELDYNKKVNDYLMVYPYIKLTFERFGRNEKGNIKYRNSWNSIQYYNLTIGGGINYQLTYLKSGLIFPFNGETNNNLELENKLGFELETGIKWKKWNFAWFYRRISLYGLEHPGFELNRYCFIIRYSF